MSRVKALREQRNWDQRELAKRAGIAQSMVSDIETGKRDPKVTTAKKIAQALGVTLDELTADETAAAAQ